MKYNNVLMENYNLSKTDSSKTLNFFIQLMPALHYPTDKQPITIKNDMTPEESTYSMSTE